MDQEDLTKTFHVEFLSRNEIKIDGLSPDEYIQKLTDEMNKICIDTIPFDKWDYIIAFSLALLETAGDFFIGDPAFKTSLANKNGPFVKWLKQFHKHEGGSPLDWQGPGMLGGKGDHRAMTFGHDSLPLARLLYGSKENDEDGDTTRTGKKIYNGILLVKDILNAGLAIYCISSGTFVDCVFTKEGTYEWIKETVNQNGTPYESCNVFVAIFKWLVHMLADFCSSASLPIPGFSLLTHWPDRDVEAFAEKLYRNGMNQRTMLLQSIPLIFTEMLTYLYVYARHKDSFDETQINDKRNKMLLLTHGITSAVNIGKVIVSENPARINIILIIRTCQLIWTVLKEELKRTNRAIEKLDLGILKARVEQLQTLNLLEETNYIIARCDQYIEKCCKNIDENLRNIDEDYDNHRKLIDIYENGRNNK